MREENPDILCLQETKCAEKDLPAEITSMPEYPHKYWAVSGAKEGYSGVAMLCKTEPLKVTYGIGNASFYVLLYQFRPLNNVTEKAKTKLDMQSRFDSYTLEVN